MTPRFFSSSVNRNMALHAPRGLKLLTTCSCSALRYTLSCNFFKGVRLI